MDALRGDRDHLHRRLLRLPRFLVLLLLVVPTLRLPTLLFTESVPCLPFLRLSLVSGNMLESVSRGRLESMYWVFILAGPLILFTWIRSFRYLAFTSIIGTVMRRVSRVCRACVVRRVVRVSCGDEVLNKLSCCSPQQAILRWCWP